MDHVYILIITDTADFGRVTHRSAWTSYEGARAEGQEIIFFLVANDNSGFGNTYNMEICAMEVFT